MRQRPWFVLFALAALGCLRVPPPPPPSADAGPFEDAGPARLEILGVAVRDPHGRAWSLAGAPTSARFHVALNANGAPPLFLLTGPPDAELESDLEVAPLRASNADRTIRCAVVAGDHELVLTPLEPLARGAVLTLAAGAWRAEPDALSLDAPFVQEITVSASPLAGARVRDAWPPDGFAAVPPSITSLGVRFDGPVEGIEAALSLRDPMGAVPTRVGRVPCARFGWATGDCAELTPLTALTPTTEHTIAADGAIDATGAVVPTWEARFTTAASEDLEPPDTLALPCALDELAVAGLGCALEQDMHITLTSQATEPVIASLELGAIREVVASPRGALRFELADLPPEHTLSGHLRLVDLAGLARLIEIELATTPRLLGLAITEVRADPHGREPAQEYVEVLNFGAVAVDLTGISLSDRPDLVGDVVALPMTLQPGQRALLVSDDFDPDDEADEPVPPGTPLVRLGRSIATGGLTNAGEALFLRDLEGHRLSATPTVATGAGLCLARIDAARPRTDAPEAFSVQACTPGRAP